MSHLRTAHLQALYARRREAEHNHIERTEAINKYYDHWGKVTSRFENWSAPEYYKQAEQQLQKTKDEKEKKKRLNERQQRLSQLLEKEKKTYELELQERDRSRRTRRYIPTRTLEKMEENLKEQQQLRRKLELEAKLYGNWRHGVDDENLVFESKTDNEVLAKLNWLDKQVNQQFQREKEEDEHKERDLKMQEQLNITEQLQTERQKLREQEIREIRALQEKHMHELKEKQTETDFLKEREKTLRANLLELEKELQLLEESFNALKKPIEFGNSFSNIKMVARKRADEFRNQLKLCMSIMERTLDYAEKAEHIRVVINKMQNELDAEKNMMVQLEGMYESEVKQSLRKSEETWQYQHEKRNEEIKEILTMERQAMRDDLDDIMQKQEHLIEIRSTHLGVIEKTGEKLKQLIQEEENSPRHQQLIGGSDEKEEDLKEIVATRRYPNRQGEESRDSPLYAQDHQNMHNIRNENRPAAGDYKRRGGGGGDGVGYSHVSNKNCDESDNNMSPRCFNSRDHNDINQSSNSFNNTNIDNWQNNPHPSQRNRDDMRLKAQHEMQVVTVETEANRPRFGKTHQSHEQGVELQKTVSFSQSHVHKQAEESDDFPLYSSSKHHGDMTPDSDTTKREQFSSHTNCNESENNLSPRCYDSHDHNELDQASNSFDNENLNEWQSNPHLTKNELDTMRQNAQRPLQVVTAETEANRSRYGRHHLANSQIHDASAPHSNAEETDNNLSPRCFDAQDHNDINQASNTFNNLNLDDWQSNPHHTKNELDTMRQNAQREMQVVTEETELNRPRFGRKNLAWD